MHTLQLYDEQLMQLINHQGSFFTDMFWFYYTNKLFWLLAVICIFYTIWARSHNWRDFLALLLALGVLALLTDWFPAHYVRPFFARPRPSHTEGLEHMLHYVNNYRGGAYGFFSNHASNAFGAVTMLYMLFRSRWMAFVGFTWAILLCYSRLYLGVHFLGDILAGALWGVAVALVIYSVYAMFHRRMTETSGWPSIAQSYRQSEPWLIIGSIGVTVIVIALIAALATWGIV